jgi:hypothetical protein
MFNQSIKTMRIDQFSSIGGSLMQTAKKIDREEDIIYDWEDNICMAYIDGVNGQGLGYSEKEARRELQDSWDSLSEYEEELLCLSVTN